MMFVALLATVLGKILGGGGAADPPIAVAPQVEKEKCVDAERSGRTDEEIVQDAQRSFEKGEVYFKQWQISDDSLSVALEAFCAAKADLRLVDKSKWPAFSRELGPAMEAAEEKVSREYSRIRISYNHYQQMGDLQAALQEMQRALVLIPENSDERHQFARRKIGAVKAKMSGQGEQNRWDDRK
jgi:tetratricopeptide (TPR) repeat protein